MAWRKTPRAAKLLVSTPPFPLFSEFQISYPYNKHDPSIPSLGNPLIYVGEFVCFGEGVLGFLFIFLFFLFFFFPPPPLTLLRSLVLALLQRIYLLQRQNNLSYGQQSQEDVVVVEIMSMKEEEYKQSPACKCVITSWDNW